MSVATGATCPSCNAAVAAGSAFCTRCGAPVAVREIVVPDAADQQWGGQRRRDRRGDRGAGAGSPGGRAGAPAVVASGSPTPRGVAGGQVAVLAASAAPVMAAGPAVPGAVAQASAAALGPAFDGVTPAGVGRRVTAYTLDLMAVAVVGGLVWWLTGRQVVYAGLAAGELAVGLVLWEARGGLTLGNAALGLRTAAVERPFAPGLGRAVGRALLLGVSNLLAGIGPWVLVATSGADRSGRGQAWHDRAARTVVVDVRAMRVAAEPVDVVRPPVVTTTAVAPTPTPAPAPPVAPVLPAQSSAPRVVPVPPAAAPAPPVAPTLPTAASVPPAVAPPATPAAQPRPATPASPAAAAQVPAVPAAAPGRRGYVLTLDSGEVVQVTGTGVIGRRPRADEGEQLDHVVGVDDPSRSMSRTHAAFGVADGVFWVADRGSANGTFLRDAAGTWHRLEPGARYPVAPGGVVRLGERSFAVASA